ncbi:hypothetical protein Patl1_37191 [Pistacia atlantica]|nr:hypothetical protein Patl1_37191 [Pistacia atlantica]
MAYGPTLTASMAFVRAVSQTGMSLSTIEHRPRALTGLCLMVLKIPDDLPITMKLVLKDKAVSKTGRQ